MTSNTPWYLYIASSKSGKYYVGITTHVENRLAAHNTGQGAHLAKFDGPFTLKYVSHELEDQSVARKLEMKIKKWSREKKKKLISGKESIHS